MTPSLTPSGQADSAEAAGIGRRGLMLVLSSPSGAGKTTISRRLLAADQNLAMSVSVTTRPQRPGEIDGQDYAFISPDRFERLRADQQLLEHAHVFGHRYGTPRGPVEEALRRGQDVLFDIDWQGTQQLKESARDDLVSVFVLPPTAVELERRLRGRALDPPDVIAGRMAKASAETSHYREYDYVLINRDVEKSVAEVMAILAAERLRLSRLTGISEFVNQMIGDLERT